MNKKYLRLEGVDHNGVYGRYYGDGNKRLVIHIHGLTHHAGSLLEVTSSEFFLEKGYDHYRVSLYDGFHDSRKLSQSTLSTHVKDMTTILDHFQNAYEEIFVTGHSLGGLTTLILNPLEVKAISLWDPSLDVTNFWASGPYLTPVPERKQYLLDYGNIFVLDERMVEEIKHYPDARCLDLAKEISTPTQFVILEESIFLASPHTSPSKYRKAFHGDFDLHHVKGANHCFSNHGDRQELFETTLKWFNKYSGV